MNEQSIATNRLHVPYIVDETLREGVERTPFPISLDVKCDILKAIAETGIRDFIVGCGPEVPSVWKSLFTMREQGDLPADTEPTFIVLLNCWETAYEHFKNPAYSKDWIKSTTFSFGMITHLTSERCFDRAVEAFAKLGATRFKASVLNNFRTGISEEKYTEICAQIDWALKLGVRVIRINDSLGSLQPRLTYEIASRLVAQYPNITFCLHAHNDYGLAVANTLAAIEAGFKMVEGSVGGFGNRSGIAPLEQVVHVCQACKIEIGEHSIDLEKLARVAQLVERSFLAVPNVYRPVSGIWETESNFGVLNIPDFLDSGDEKEYFVNYAGLHPYTIRKAIERHVPDLAKRASTAQLWAIVQQLRIEMEASFGQSVLEYDDLMRQLASFYTQSRYTTQKIAARAREMLGPSLPGVQQQTVAL